MTYLKVGEYPLLSFPRTRESRKINPAAGLTGLETFCEAIKIKIMVKTVS